MVIARPVDRGLDAAFPVETGRLCGALQVVHAAEELVR